MASIANEGAPNMVGGGSNVEQSTVSSDLNFDSVVLKEQDNFTSSLNSEDYLESLAPIMKDALRENGLANLITKLNGISRQKDEELNNLSLDSANDINSCMDNIDMIHDESDSLSKDLTQISQFLHKSTHELINKKKNLIKIKEVGNRINETILVLSLCLQVLEITSKIHELIKQKRYFSALKLTDELQSIHLPKVEHFSFAAKIYESIPHLSRMIKDESFDNITKWLAINIERKVFTIGENLFENLAHLQDYFEKTKKQPIYASFSHQRINSPVELSLRDPSLNYNIFSDPILQIDAAALFDAILVYQTLGEDDYLSKLYNKEWLKKYNRIIYPISFSVNSGDESTQNEIPGFSDLKSLEQYLKKIAAFFVIDKQINIQTKFQLRTNNNADELWDSYSAKLKPVLLNYLKKHKLNIDEVIEFKDLIGNFLLIIDNSGYKINELYEILMILLKDHYAVELMTQFRTEFIESIQSDHYMPLVVYDRRDYDNIMQICWYKQDAAFAPKNVSKMPISFPFSEDYVHYCLGIRTLLEDITRFIKVHYSYNSNEVNAIIVDVFEKVLGDKPKVGIVSDIKEFVTRNSSNKEIVAQSYTNLEFYLYSIYQLGKLINFRLRSVNGVGVYSTDSHGAFTLQAIESLTKVRKFSEETIFQMVDTKVKELLDMLEYQDWMPDTPNKEANYSVKDFALFLDNLFTSIFSNLPSTFRTLGLFRSYDYISEHLLNTLRGAERYNKTAIDNFDLDVRYLEDSMKKFNSETKVNLGDEGGAVSLESTFTELRQCIDLLKLDNYNEFTKNPAFRMRKFDRIKLEDGLKLISKMYEPEKAGFDNSDLERTPTPSAYSVDSQGTSGLTSTASLKFAKFSNKFKKPTVS